MRLSQKTAAGLALIALLLVGRSAPLFAAPGAGPEKAAGHPPAIRTIRFSGYEWEVRPAEVGGPGPNHWDDGNVRVDATGALHLKITKKGNVWRCAEVYTKKTFGFGRYQFQVTGPIDRLDRSVVFGLFNYPLPAVGPDGTNEIDIEYSHWGNPAYPLGNYTVYPAHPGLPPGSQTFPVTPDTPDTTQSFVWQSDSVTFQSAHGLGGDAAPGFAAWDYRPGDGRHVPQKPLPVHINLWLFAGAVPRDGREVEVVVHKFSYLPAKTGPLVAASAGGRPWVCAYYLSGDADSGRLPAAAIDYAAITHLIHFGLFPNADGTLGPVSGVIPEGDSKTVLALAHAAGRKVLVSMGTDEGAKKLRAALTDSVRSALVRNLVQFVVSRGYDGLDLDVEPLGDSDVPAYAKFVPELRAALDAARPGLLLTAAVASQPALFARLQGQFDRINLMTYDNSGPWPGHKTWYNAGLYGAGSEKMNPTEAYPSVDGTVKQYEAAGIPAAKLGIGVAFYGYVWNRVTGPKQDVKGLTAADINDGADYSLIMDKYYQPDRYHWDDQAQAPYLSIEAPDPKDRKFISYDDARLCALKIGYVKQQGLGGVILWELGGGYRAGQPPGQRDPLLQAVKKAWAAP